MCKNRHLRLKKLNEFNDAINTYRSVRNDVNKDVCGMHVFQIESLTDIIYAIPITIVCKPFLGNISPYPHLPVCWADFACCSIATCFKACSRVVAYDVRPDEHLTCKAETCMLLLIELSKVCFSIKYIICIAIYQLERILRESIVADRTIHFLQG